jgi:hypothetical protein
LHVTSMQSITAVTLILLKYPSWKISPNSLSTNSEISFWSFSKIQYPENIS